RRLGAGGVVWPLAQMLVTGRHTGAFELELDAVDSLREVGPDQPRKPFETGRLRAGRAHSLPGDLVGEPFPRPAAQQARERSLDDLLRRRDPSQCRRRIPLLHRHHTESSRERRTDQSERVCYKGPMPRILVADDDRHLAELLRATLDEAGFEAVAAHSGLAAAALIEREDFDLLVLDVLMPGMSGDAIADLIHQLKPDVPVLLMTGDPGDQFVRDAELPRLRKPFTERELVDAVHGLLAAN